MRFKAVKFQDLITKPMTPLFQEFESVSKARWLEKVGIDLKGKPIESLNWNIGEEIHGSPFYHREDLKGHFSSLQNGRSSNKWEMGSYIIVDNLTTANKQALASLKGGAEALYFLLSHPVSKADLTLLLKGIQHEWISTHFSVHQRSWPQFGKDFIETIQTKKQALDRIKCSFRLTDFPYDSKALQELVQLNSQIPLSHFLTINVHQSSPQSGGVIEELAYSLHKGNCMLIQLHHAKLLMDNWYQPIQFCMSVDDHYFLNIAKIRALKLLWRNILFAWDESLTDQAFIEVHLSAQSKSKEVDYNKIKLAAQAMSAIIGGVDRLFVYPSDISITQIGTPFSQRIALNIQHILQRESYLDRVIDPSAGSYFIESLTETIAKKAWTKFQQLEATNQ